jgi:hypothetical protein
MPQIELIKKDNCIFEHRTNRKNKSRNMARTIFVTPWLLLKQIKKK